MSAPATPIPDHIVDRLVAFVRGIEADNARARDSDDQPE